MGSTASSSLQECNAGIIGQQVRFLDRDPVPSSLRGREGRLEQVTQQSAIVWAGGIRRHVPKDWLAMKGSLVPDQPTLTLTQPADLDAEGDNDLITQQAWYNLLDTCLELNLSPEEAQEVIAGATGIPPNELDPSRLTWQQYLQVIEQLEQLESTS